MIDSKSFYGQEVKQNLLRTCVCTVYTLFKIFSINQTLLLLFGFETFLIRNGENGKHIVEMGFGRAAINQ